MQIEKSDYFMNGACNGQDKGNFYELFNNHNVK
jgi:hypothetical protein